MRLRKALVLGWALVPMLSASAAAELLTLGGAIGCLTPDKLPAAEEAYKKHDRVEMDRLGCFPISTGTTAKRLNAEKSGSSWQVTLDPNGQSPLDVWARASSFREN